MSKKILANSDILASRNELYGIAALWILLFHICRFAGCDIKPMEIILKYGNAGVDIFLFFSAVGLVKSIQKNSLRQFYKNRVKRLLMPYLVCAVIYFTWYDFIAEKDGIIRWIMNVTTISWWMGDFRYPMWYVPFAAGLYAVFPLLYKADRKTKHISSCLIFFLSIAVAGLIRLFEISFFENNFMVSILRIPIFMLGLILSEYLWTDKGIPYSWVIALGVIGILAFIYNIFFSFSVYIKYLTYIPITLAIAAVYSAFVKWLPVKRALNNIGLYSYEIYVTHEYLVNYIKGTDKWGILPGAAWYAVIIGSTCVMVFLLTKILKGFEKISLRAADAANS